MRICPAAFAWQEGYAAVSVSPSQKDVVVRYIHNQKEHHSKQPFEEELLELLRKIGMDFDPEDVLG